MARNGNTFQFGYDHRLYVGTETITYRDYNVGDPFPTIRRSYNDITWQIADLVRDVNVGGSENTVDVTTRDEARFGFTVEPVVSQTGQITAQIRWEPSGSATLADTNAVFKQMLKAWRSRSAISLMELDGAYDAAVPANNIGVQGFVGNFNVSFTWNKPVQGVTVIDLNARLVGFPDWIVHDGVVFVAPAGDSGAPEVILTASTNGFRPIEQVA